MANLSFTRLCLCTGFGNTLEYNTRYKIWDTSFSSILLINLTNDQVMKPGPLGVNAITPYVQADCSDEEKNNVLSFNFKSAI